MHPVIKNNIHVVFQGEQFIIFAHGFGCDQNMWKFVIPDFLDDYRVILFDYSGSGRSDVSEYDPKKYSSLDGYAQDILNICEAYQLEDVVIVGHSVSATIATLATLTSPHYFSRLIILSPSPSFLNALP